jgi:hypothetical protein
MQTRIFGYSALTPSEILTSVDLGRSQVERPGDWTVAEENDSGELLRLASSTVAVTPCFLAMDVKRRLHVGATVFDVARQADLPWDWNRRAVECLALFGHTIGSDTLHPKVSRVANDIYLPEPVSSLAERPLGSWLPTKSGSTSHEDALAVLRRVFRRDAGGSKVLLSLSAGYDSRLLLSLCLDLGIHPRCVTTGFAQSTDVVVAEAICREFGLPHERIELCPDDYLAEGNTIAYLTNGSALASHWHTYLYARAAASSAAEIHLVGSNGEYARNFYIPRRGQFAILERSPGSLLPLYWATRLERRRAHFRSLPLIAAHGPKAYHAAEWAI